MLQSTICASKITAEKGEPIGFLPAIGIPKSQTSFVIGDFVSSQRKVGGKSEDFSLGTVLAQDGPRAGGSQRPTRQLWRSPTASRASAFSVPVELGTDWLRRPLEFVGQESMVAFLGQVEEEGYTTWNDKDLILSWESVYRLADSDEYRSGLTLTEMPAILPWRPRLESQGGLGDQDFAVLLAGWIGPSGQTIHGDLSLRGAVASWRGEESLLTRAAWN